MGKGCGFVRGLESFRGCGAWLPPFRLPLRILEDFIRARSISTFSIKEMSDLGAMTDSLIQ